MCLFVSCRPVVFSTPLAPGLTLTLISSACPILSALSLLCCRRHTGSWPSWPSWPRPRCRSASLQRCPLPAPPVLHPRRSPPLARGRDAAIHSAALPLRQEPPRFLGRAVTVQLGLLQLEPQGPFVADDVRNVLVGLGVPVQLQDWLGLCSSLRAGACVPTGSESYLAALGALIPPLSCLHSFSCFLFRNLQCISAAVQPSWVSIDLPSRAGRGVTTSGCLGMGWSRWSLGRSGSPVGQADTSL